MSKPLKGAQAAPRTSNPSDARDALRVPPRAPAAPPVYRPQPVPKVLQRKEAVPARVHAPHAPTPRARDAARPPVPARPQPNVQRPPANVQNARAHVALPQSARPSVVPPPARAAVTRPSVGIERPAAPQPPGAPVIQRMRETRSHHREKRPSRDERNIERFKKETLKSVDKGGRTRASKKAITSLEKKLKKKELTLEDLKPLIDATPPHKLQLSGKKIYSGKWRSFSTDFQRNWWNKQTVPWTCHICDGVIDPRGVGTDAPSIDHREPWARVKLGIDDFEVCKGGQHWRVVLSEDVRAVIEDESNLLPSHQGCNSGKNGPKDTDSLAPQRMGKCPGRDCTAPNAE